MLSNTNVLVGIAHSDYIDELLIEMPGIFDYVEIPFEQLVRVPSAIEIKQFIPVILHCASLSIAGNAKPDSQLVKQLKHWINVSETPWLGEHIAYVRTDGSLRDCSEHEALTTDTSSNAPVAVAEAPRKQFNIGYAVSPQLSAPILNRVVETAEYWASELGVPIILENGPIYFCMPGSTMSQVEFIQSLCLKSNHINLLLDLSHLLITCNNLKIDPRETLMDLPLDRVVEIHISGAREEQRVMWDDHATPASEIIFELLECLLTYTKPRAVTLEYNWDSTFPRDVLQRDVMRVRNLLR